MTLQVIAGIHFDYFNDQNSIKDFIMNEWTPLSYFSKWYNKLMFLVSQISPTQNIFSTFTIYHWLFCILNYRRIMRIKVIHRHIEKHWYIKRRLGKLFSGKDRLESCLWTKAEVNVWMYRDGWFKYSFVCRNRQTRPVFKQCSELKGQFIDASQFLSHK